MADIVRDTFTEASDTALTAHTPDVGTGWTEVANDASTSIFNVDSIADTCKASVSQVVVHIAASCEPDPTSAEYTMDARMQAASGTAEGIGLFARRTDNDNFYAFQLLAPGDASNSVKLFKQVSSTDTELGSFDAPSGGFNRYQLIITDAKKSIVLEGIELLSSTDNALTSIGDTGIWIGNYVGDSVNISTNASVDELRTLDVAQEVFATSDISVSTWTDEGGATTSLFQSIDEVSADDDDYIKSVELPVNTDAEFHIGDPTDPSVGTGHYIHYRARNPGYGSQDLRVRLLDGATEIFTVTHTFLSNGLLTWSYFRRELSSTEANNITDYTDLRLEFRAV